MLTILGLDFLYSLAISFSVQTSRWHGPRVCCLFLACFLLWGFSGPPLNAQKQALQTEVLSVEQGLSSSHTSVILQDRQGFIWIGTLGGLNRYDGYGIKTFRNLPGDSTSLPSNIITAFHVDRQGVLWVGTPMGLSRYNDDNETFTSYVAKPGDARSLSHNLINFVYEDRDGQLWISTSGGGLNLFDRARKTFSSYSPLGASPQVAIKNTIITEFCEDRQRDHQLWMSVWTEGVLGLYSFDTRTKTFTRRDTGIDWGSNEVHSVMEDRSGHLWLGTAQGLAVFDKTARTLRWFNQDPNAPKGEVTNCMEDRQGKIWACGFGSGLHCYDPKKGRFERFTHDPSNAKGVSNNKVHSVMEDRSGVLWFTTDGGGVNRWQPGNERFQSMQTDPANPRYVIGGIVTALCEDRSGRVWIGNNWKGLDCYNRRTGRFEPIDFKSGDLRKIATSITAIKEDQKGQIWVGTSRQGLFCLDPEQRTFVRYTADPANPTGLGSNNIRTIQTDASGGVWLGTPAGLARFDPATGQFAHFRHDPAQAAGLPGNEVYALYKDRSGALWVGTNGGLSRMAGSSGRFRHFLRHTADAPNRNNEWVYNILEDRVGNIWAGTGRGLYRLHFTNGPDALPQTDFYSEANGLLDNVISGILEDGQGRLWISSFKGLTVFKNPQYGESILPDCRHYGLSDGLCGFFEDKSHFKNQQGELFFGGENGYNVFHPDSIDNNTYPPQVAITGFEKLDTDRPEAGPVAERGMAARSVVTLSHKNNIFTISFAALDFRNPAQNRYAYQLEGFDDHWIQLGTQHQVTFTNLDPGTYVFRVKGANNDGVWNETATELTIVVAPPWYRTWVAYICYAVLIVGSIYFFYQYQLRRRLEAAEAERLKSLDAFKNRFFTNITHEFRTPLTVILGVSEQVLSDEVVQSHPVTIAKPLSLIKRNGENLLRLINQILDLAKLESNTLKINYEQGDVLAYLRYIAESLHSLADTQNVQLRFEGPDKPGGIVMDYDPERLLQIVHNLLSNAIKFTPGGGSVVLHVATLEAPGTAPMLKIAVADTGQGIAMEALPFLFDRFFQAKNQQHAKAGGTGIGLSLTHELVKVMGGEISVESPVPGSSKGTLFTVTLPMLNKARLSERTVPAGAGVGAALRQVDTAPHPDTVPLVLLIEDNPDVVTYLSACLKDKYRLDFAYNGREGIEKALQIVPDLIITDVMMPEKDGFEVCDFLKNDERTSHIPLVMLTAKVTVEDRLAGLRRGADAYLAKPFREAELLVWVEQLIARRKMLQARYAHLALSGMAAAKAAEVGNRQGRESSQEPLSPAELVLEDTFIQKFRDVLEANYTAPEFSVELICQKMAMSRAQLYRKLSALTGRSVTEHLNDIRLEKARLLLLSGGLNVSEVAYTVGYNDPKYFSRLFADAFGQSPSDFAQKG